MPLTQFDENNLMHYPQIINTFAESITDEQVADLSVALENEGVDAFNINNNELKISVITFLSPEQQNNLTNDEQYNEKFKEYQSKSSSAATAVNEILGSNALDGGHVAIKKSSYQGAINEGTSDQTRKYDRSDVLKAFQESPTKVETPAVELADKNNKIQKKESDKDQVTQETVPKPVETQTEVTAKQTVVTEDVVQEDASQVLMRLVSIIMNLKYR